MSDLRACDKCGNEFPINDLDAKPTMTNKLRKVGYLHGQIEMLKRADDLGFSFDRLECAICYGPGYCSLVGAQ